MAQPAGKSHHAEVQVSLAATPPKLDPSNSKTGVQDTGQHSNISTATSSDSWSAEVMWAFFCFGWVVMPCWWAVIAVGLTTGRDTECMFKRKAGLTGTQNAAWWASLFMTVVGAVALLLGCAVFFGHLSRDPGEQMCRVHKAKA